jgi:cytochrome bd-type quinol oxidase subunit 2
MQYTFQVIKSSVRDVPFLRFFPLLLIPLPVDAQGAQISEAVGVFNILVGLMLTLAILVYSIAFVMWCARLGTWPTYRTQAVKIMEWSVVILFVLVVLLGIVQFFQHHETAGAHVFSTLVVLFILWMIYHLITHSGKKKEE